MEKLFFHNNTYEPSLTPISPPHTLYSLPNIPSSSIIPYYFKTPSEYLLHIPQHSEKGLRFFFSNLLSQISTLLSLPHQTLLTSLKLLQYTYYKLPISSFDPFYIITTSLYISSKLEETPFSLHSLISAFYFIINHSHMNHIDTTSIETNIKIMEMIIMKELGYYMEPFMKHPHKYLLHIVKLIRNDVKLFKDTWGYLNDMYYTTLIVNYKNEALVCGGIYYCSRVKYIEIIDNIEWWEIFNVQFTEIEEICAEMLKLYKEYSLYDKVKVDSLLQKYSPIHTHKHNDNTKKNNDTHHSLRPHRKHSRSRSRSHSKHRSKHYSHSRYSRSYHKRHYHY